MKKLLFAFILGMASVSFADQASKVPIGPFGGLNNRDNAAIISASQAQDLLNVNISVGGKSVKKRPGYAQAFALQYTTSPVHGTYLFYNSAGNDVVLAFHDRDISASVAGGSMSVLLTTATNNSTFQCSDYLGFAYCVDSSRDALYKTDGAGVSLINGIVSTGTMVAACPTRLAMAGFSGSPSRIDFSADTDFTSWGTGSVGSSPAQLTVTSPGSRITHITYAFGRLMWFKETSFGYVLIGNQPLQTDWVIKTISNTIGTLDNSSAQDFNGNLYFRGQDGHIYVFDGSNVTKLSREISGTVSSAQTRASNSVAVSGTAGFNAGSYSGNLVFVDTETSSGNLQTTFPDNFSVDRRSGTGNKAVWISSNTGNGSSTITGGQLVLTGGTTDVASIRTISLLPSLKPGTSFQLKLDSLSSDSGTGSFRLILTTAPISPFNSNGPSVYSWMLMFFSSSTTNVTNFTAANPDAGFFGTHNGLSLPLTFNLWVATNSFSYGFNGTLDNQGSWTDSAGNAPKQTYVYLWYANSSTSGSAKVDYFNTWPASFTWTSAAETVSSAISSWDSFTASKNDSGGVINFSVKNASNGAYQSINSGAVPTFSTATYWQVISTFTETATSTGSAPVSLANVTQNWFEGSAADKAYAAFFDDKVWFSVPIGSGQSTNNRILIYDLLFQGWTLYDLPSNGFYVRNNALYFGSSNGGYVYKYGVGNNDAGAAINAYWKSKDFFGGSPFNQTVLTDLSVAANSVANSTITVTYTTDDTTSNSFTMGLGSGSGMAVKNKNLPLGISGQLYNVKFSNNAVDQPWEVYGAQVGVTSRDWRAN